MEIKYYIREITDKKFWYDSLKEFDDANIYQTWNFAGIANNEKIVKHLAIYEDENLKGLAQVRIKYAPLVKRGIAYIFRGPVWQRKNEENNIGDFIKILKALREEFVTKQKLFLRIKPCVFTDQYDEIHSLEDLGYRQLTKKKTYHTLVLYLDKDLEEIRMSFKKKWRNGLSQSKRNGLEIVRGNNSELYDDFLKTYSEMLARKKFKQSVNVERMLMVNEALEEENKLKILIAYKDGVPVASFMGSVIGNTGIWLLGGSNDLGLKYKAQYLLQWEWIQCLKNIGVKRYDLGGISFESNPKGYVFKSGITKNEVYSFRTCEAFDGILSRLMIQAGEYLRKLPA